MSPEVLDAIAAWVLAQPSRNLPPLPKPAPGAAPVGMPVPMPIPVPVPVPVSPSK
jgi:hypothetical protein